MLVTFATGIALAVHAGFFSAGWLRAKFVLVMAVGALHGYFAKLRKDFAEERNRHGAGFYRVINEVPAVLMAGIVLLVIFKPF
jgi:putative membrane protein